MGLCLTLVARLPLWAWHGSDVVLSGAGRALRFLCVFPPGLWVVQSVTLGHKRSQTRTAMAVGPVTTRVLTVHPAGLGCPEGSRPDPLHPQSPDQPGYGRRWPREVGRLVRVTPLQCRGRGPTQASQDTALLPPPYLGSRGYPGQPLGPHRRRRGAPAPQRTGAFFSPRVRVWGPESWPRGPLPPQPPLNEQISVPRLCPSHPPGTAGPAGCQSHCLLTSSLRAKPQGPPRLLGLREVLTDTHTEARPHHTQSHSRTQTHTGRPQRDGVRSC